MTTNTVLAEWASEGESPRAFPWLNDPLQCVHQVSERDGACTGILSGKRRMSDPLSCQVLPDSTRPKKHQKLKK